MVLRVPQQAPRGHQQEAHKNKEEGRQGSFVYLVETLQARFFKFGISGNIGERRRHWGTSYGLFVHRLYKCDDPISVELEYIKRKAKRDGIGLGEETSRGPQRGDQACEGRLLMSLSLPMGLRWTLHGSVRVPSSW